VGGDHGDMGEVDCGEDAKQCSRWGDRLQSVTDEDEGCPVEGMGEINGDAAWYVRSGTSAKPLNILRSDFALDEVALGLLYGGGWGFALLEGGVEGVHEALGAAVVDRPEG
jgi:hypothetical protein